ncbi:patatin-like phospholipase family protein [Pyxidicoccus trucidator]|uniref:patatin-like phospholipase family protein n=1 Tax=Pyxidicoccus trucidator TaxID=2709662 RepID=UPI0013DC9C0F|nr:patatin-like phospholipase family protein [Pyxidicoccus trucidator]
MPRANLLACAVVLLFAVSASAQAPDAGSAADGGLPPEDVRRVYMGTEFPPGNVADTGAARALATATEQSAPAIVVSGGISLGAYQAGFISTLVRFWSVARRDARVDDPMPRVWTGASAGAVNALLGGLASCDPAFEQDTWSPEQSLFWTVWVDELDLDALLPREDRDRDDHLFSAPHMQQTLALIEAQAAMPRFRKDCSFAFGITVTNLRGRDVPFGGGGPDSRAQLKRVTEKLVVQVSTQQDGTLMARTPYLGEGAPGASPPYIAIDPMESHHYPALGERPERLEGGQPVSLKNLLLTPQASGAFPLAFPPVPVSVSFFDEDQWGPLQALRLVDGGFLNNNPLDLAVRLGERWVEGAETGFNRSRFPVVYLDQDVVDWKWAKPPAPPEGSLSPLEETYFQHLGTLMNAARDSVVLDTLEHDTNLSGRVKIPRRSSVLPSEYQFAMMGFFDQRFREHDFYRGMQDAIRFLSTQLTSTRVVETLVPRVPDEPVRTRELRVLAVLGISSQGFQCMTGGACDGAKDGEQLTRLRQAMDALTARAQQETLRQADVDDLLGALGDAGYRYSTGVMGETLASGTRNDLMRARDRIGKAFHDLVSNQKGGLRVALRPAGAAFLDDWLTYSPPRHAVTLGLSRQRGLGLGLEAPVVAFEHRPEEGVYDRSELRLGGELSGFGVRDMDQLTPNKTRWRWVSLGAYADWVSDMDGFSGRVKWLQAGPFVRLRMGLGTSGGYLRDPEALAFNVLEARLGVDLMEKVGLRLAMPLYLLRFQGGEVHHGTPKFFKETSLGVEVLFTWW